jgi:hypothetical protein
MLNSSVEYWVQLTAVLSQRLVWSIKKSGHSVSYWNNVCLGKSAMVRIGCNSFVRFVIVALTYQTVGNCPTGPAQCGHHKGSYETTKWLHKDCGWGKYFDLQKMIWCDPHRNREFFGYMSRQSSTLPTHPKTLQHKIKIILHVESLIKILQQIC